MLLIYVQKLSPRIDYIFKQICNKILGIEISFTNEIEKFISHAAPKISYGPIPLGTELFFEASGLLSLKNIEAIEVHVEAWEDTYGFFRLSDKSALPYDIFSAAFYLLTRYEEYLPYQPNEVGAFPHTQSLAYEHGFLEQAIVDIWARMFLEKLLESFPDLKYNKNKLEVNTLVGAKQPFAYANQNSMNSLIGYIKDLSLGQFYKLWDRTKTLIGLQADPFDTFSWISQSTKTSNKKFTVFFMMNNARELSQIQNFKSPKYHEKIKLIGDYQEVGLLFSKDSIYTQELMKLEKNRLEAVTHRPVESSLFVDASLKLPEAYRGLLQLEIAKDYSMSYDDVVGFRAGTCTDFLFYDLEYEVKTPLLIKPVAIRTKALRTYDNQTAERKIECLLNQIKRMGGSLNFLFSNQDFSQYEENDALFWKELFKKHLDF